MWLRIYKYNSVEAANAAPSTGKIRLCMYSKIRQTCLLKYSQSDPEVRTVH